jgi:hypothetical protein
MVLHVSSYSGEKKQSILPCCHDFDEVLPQETPVAPRMAQGNIKIKVSKQKAPCVAAGNQIKSSFKKLTRKLRAWLRGKSYEKKMQLA